MVGWAHLPCVGDSGALSQHGSPQALSRSGHRLPAPKQVAQAAPRVSHDDPAEIQSAKEKLESARKHLRRAGDEWGGFRVDAIKNIDQALQNLSKAMEYRQENMKKIAPRRRYR